jgi:hypothetical protein
MHSHRNNTHTHMCVYYYAAVWCAVLSEGPERTPPTPPHTHRPLAAARILSDPLRSDDPVGSIHRLAGWLAAMDQRNRTTDCWTQRP